MVDSDEFAAHQVPVEEHEAGGRRSVLSAVLQDTSLVTVRDGKEVILCNNDNSPMNKV